MGLEVLTLILWVGSGLLGSFILLRKWCRDFGYVSYGEIAVFVICGVLLGFIGLGVTLILWFFWSLADLKFFKRKVECKKWK